MVNKNLYGNRDRHSALKTQQIGSFSAHGVQFVKTKLQWGKDDIGYSLHAAPSSFSSYGIQTTDFLAYLGFERGPCAFTQSRECYSEWVPEDFDLENFSGDFDAAFKNLEKSERAFENCGYRLIQPEGWGYFFGKSGHSQNRSYGRQFSTDGHTSPKTEVMKNYDDNFFQFVLSWMEGGNEKGWTFHYRPKHPPLSPEFEVAIRYLNLSTFKECQCFDFESCFWKFIPFEKRGDSLFDSNADIVHRWFDAHPNNFSEAINTLLMCQSLLDPYEFRFLPVEQKESDRSETQIERNIKRSDKSTKRQSKKYDFDVAISFAGSERELAENMATLLKNSGYDVFYDDFYPEQLWGRDLVAFFDEVYRKRAKYCVIFVSSEYCDRMWTNHERKSAQARGLVEKGNEYILPIKVDDSELPGMPPTTGYLSIGKYGIEKIVDILIKKMSLKNSS